MNILTINAGSTSMKLALVSDGVTVRRFESLDEARSAVPRLDAIGHRLVHGGTYDEPVLVDDHVRRDLAELVELDPLHEPAALAAIDSARAAWPHQPHVACFDTTFHTTIPSERRQYAIPLPWREQALAYGFHGLSHQWSVQRVSELAPTARRVVVAHLGGGSSLCGAVAGRSQITTMGFTPLDGLVMGTRVGRIDPGAVMWLARQPHVDVEDTLSRHSGLVGLTGTSDMREVISRADAGDPAASFGLDVWEHRLLFELGGCVAALGGIDALVFTGGIGEHADDLRMRVLGKLSWLGISPGRFIALTPDSGERELETVPSGPRVFVVPAREELVIAVAARRLLG